MGEKEEVQKKKSLIRTGTGRNLKETSTMVRVNYIYHMPDRMPAK